MDAIEQFQKQYYYKNQKSKINKKTLNNMNQEEYDSKILYRKKEIQKREKKREKINKIIQNQRELKYTDELLFVDDRHEIPQLDDDGDDMYEYHDRTEDKSNNKFNPIQSNSKNIPIKTILIKNISKNNLRKKNSNPIEDSTEMSLKEFGDLMNKWQDDYMEMANNKI